MTQSIGILGSGSWATALAKIVMENTEHITWYIRRQEVIDEFTQTGKNPGYLNNTCFDVSKISFSTDINDVVAQSDILVLAIPSPYILNSLRKLRRSLKRKIILSAVKGMISEENVLVTDYLHYRYQVPYEQLLVIAGPCHAEEIAMDRLSYLTIGCSDIHCADSMATLLRTPYVHVTTSTDVDGLEYSSVMKNIYAIAAGVCHSLRYGDNFQSVLISNAIQEISRFTLACSHGRRNIDASGYLGDVLVTCYSRFSRNRQFGQMIGMGYSVKSAQIEMQMIAEGYYGTECIHRLNERLQVSLPIVDAVFAILYLKQSPAIVIKELTNKLS